MMPYRLTLKCAGTALAALVILGMANPARAGFQWLPSDNAASAGGSQPVVIGPPLPAPRPAMNYPATNYSSSGNAPEIISPVIISGSANPPPEPMAQDSMAEIPSYSGSVSDSAPGAPAVLRPATATTYTAAPAYASAPPPMAAGTLGTLSAPAPMSASPGDTVHGFAKNVPLVVAMRQILPAGYAFAVDANIDMGTPVSFTGGHAWRDTLRSALAPVGLSMREQGQMVSIGHGGDTMTAPAAASTAMDAPVNKVAPLSPVAYRTGMEPQPLKPLPATTVTSVGGDIVTPLSSGPGLSSLSAEPVNGNWSAERGDNLKKVLENWCRRAHVEFDWLAEYDYPLQASVSFSGSFEDAVRSLLAGFEGAHPQPVAELHNNPALRQTVLIVQTRGNTAGD